MPSADRVDEPREKDPTPLGHQSHEPLDEWLRRELLDAFPPDGDTTRWPGTEVARVMARLESTRSGPIPLVAEILWISDVTAFTLPGHYVYISRRLLERCATDDPIAFALSHEIAHHELGHLHGVDEAAATVPRGVPSVIAARLALAMAAMLIDRRVHGPENEANADARALELCVAAGYHGERCIQLLDILETDSLDRGDVANVFGLEDALDPIAREQHPRLLEARVWAWERLHGYLPIRERKARLRAQLAKMNGGGARGDLATIKQR